MGRGLVGPRLHIMGFRGFLSVGHTMYAHFSGKGSPWLSPKSQRVSRG